MASVDTTPPPPLSTALSQVLVAFTIELDNAFELAMPHCTTAKIKAGMPVNGHRGGFPDGS